MEVQNGNVFHSVFLCSDIRSGLRDVVMDGANFFHQTREENQMGNMILFASYIPGQADFVGMLLALLVLTFCYLVLTRI